LRLTTIDAHAGGGAVRLVTGGIEVPRGRSLRVRRASLDRIAAPWLGALLSEPRGSPDTTVAVLTEPDRPEAHAGVLLLRRESAPPFSGHALMAVAALATNRGLITTAAGPQGPVVLETVTGPVEVHVEPASPAGGSARVRYVSRSAWVIAGGVEVVVERRRVLVDVVCCDEFPMVLVDAESAGVGLREAARPVLQRVARDLMAAVSSKFRPAPDPLDDAVRHGRVPLGPALKRRAANTPHPIVSGVVFTSPDETGQADLRTCAIWEDGTMDRSPSGRAAAGIVALFDELRFVPEDRALVLRGPAGGTFEVRIAGRETLGDAAPRQPGEPLVFAPATGRGVRVEVSGTVWPTGDHAFVIDPADPLSGVGAAQR